MLDTHVLIWAVSDPERLDGPTRAAIVLPDNQVLVSIASVWEIAIKQAQGRLESIMPSAGAINDASDGPRDASGGTSAPSSVPVGESGNPLFVSIAWGTHRHKTMAHIYPSIGPNQPSAPQPHEHRTQHGNAAWRGDGGRVGTEHEQLRPFDDPPPGMPGDERAATPLAP